MHLNESVRSFLNKNLIHVVSDYQITLPSDETITRKNEKYQNCLLV